MTRVVYPGRPTIPITSWPRACSAACFGNMLCFELEGGREAVNRFLRGAAGIPFSPSLGHTTTTCSHPGTTSTATPPRPRRPAKGSPTD